MEKHDSGISSFTLVYRSVLSTILLISTVDILDIYRYNSYPIFCHGFDLVRISLCLSSSPLFFLAAPLLSELKGE
jgi:hypothetical protein